jgi:hypothetical protein
VTLRRLQRGLERLYRLNRAPDVRRFLIDANARRELSARGDGSEPREPAEQVFVGGNADDLELSLFVADHVLANLARHNPGVRLDEHNLRDLLLATEAVSHFLCVIHCAREKRPVRALELELQAEVDKYVVCLLLVESQGGRAAGLADRLQARLQLADDLLSAERADERARYTAAAEWADAYARALDRQFVRRQRLVELLCEVRKFYRLNFQAKRERITALAA